MQCSQAACCVMYEGSMGWYVEIRSVMRRSKTGTKPEGGDGDVN